LPQRAQQLIAGLKYKPRGPTMQCAHLGRHTAVLFVLFQGFDAIEHIRLGRLPTPVRRWSFQRLFEWVPLGQ